MSAVEVNELARFFEGRETLNVPELTQLLWSAFSPNDARQLPAERVSRDTIKSWFQPDASLVHDREGGAYADVLEAIPKLATNGGSLGGKDHSEIASATEEGKPILAALDRLVESTRQDFQHKVIYDQTYKRASDRVGDLVTNTLDLASTDVSAIPDSIPKSIFLYFLRTIKGLWDLRNDRLIPYYWYKREK